MKKLYLLSLLICALTALPIEAVSQKYNDLIILKNGDTIQCLVAFYSNRSQMLNYYYISQKRMDKGKIRRVIPFSRKAEVYVDSIEYVLISSDNKTGYYYKTFKLGDIIDDNGRLTIMKQTAIPDMVSDTVIIHKTEDIYALLYKAGFELSGFSKQYFTGTSISFIGGLVTLAGGIIYVSIPVVIIGGAISTAGAIVVIVAHEKIRRAGNHLIDASKTKPPAD